MEIERGKTLVELGYEYIGSTEFDSSLVKRCNELTHKPLIAFTVEDLRIMIGQEIALGFLVPIAIELLEDNLFAEGDYYPGDLLHTVLTVDTRFWRENPDSYWQLYETVIGLLPTMETLMSDVKQFVDNKTPVEGK